MPGDVVLVECGACENATAIPHNGLVHGLQFQPTERCSTWRRGCGVESATRRLSAARNGGRPRHAIKCGACGHTAEIPPSGLLRGLGLKPAEKVLDLERRLRCRLCQARGQALVSIKWKATS